MLLTPHTLVGLTIAASVSNPAVAVPLSFACHFLGDKVPHWDFFSNTSVEERKNGWRTFAVMGDLITGVFVGLTFTYYALWNLGNPDLALNMLLCGIASVAPDVMAVPFLYFEKSNRLFDLVNTIQGKMQFQAPLPWGILTQIAVSGFCLAILAQKVL